jgi:GxxExxY protein
MKENCTLLYSEEVRNIVNCGSEVSNILGPGLSEKPYERVLCREFSLRKIPYSQHQKFQLFYKNTSVGYYIPDLTVFDKIIVEIKSIDKITQIEVAQILNYLRITGYKVGLILNFKHRKLEWKKFVL